MQDEEEPGPEEGTNTLTKMEKQLAVIKDKMAKDEKLSASDLLDRRYIGPYVENLLVSQKLRGELESQGVAHPLQQFADWLNANETSRQAPKGRLLLLI